MNQSDTKINEDHQKEKLILEHIRKHKRIHHNELKRLVVPKHMAALTFDRKIKALTEHKLVGAERQGNKKYYTLSRHLPDAIKNEINTMKEFLNEYLDALEGMDMRNPLSSNKKLELLMKINEINFEMQVHCNMFLESLGLDHIVTEL